MIIMVQPSISFYSGFSFSISQNAFGCGKWEVQRQAKQAHLLPIRPIQPPAFVKIVYPFDGAGIFDTDTLNFSSFQEIGI